ncbi:unnamed protein product, partial [Dibothriocephalus latus]
SKGASGIVGSGDLSETTKDSQQFLSHSTQGASGEFLGGSTGTLRSLHRGHAEKPATVINDADFPCLSVAAELPRRLKGSLTPTTPNSAGYDNRHSVDVDEPERIAHADRRWPFYYPVRNIVFFPPTYPIDYPDPYAVYYDPITFQSMYEVPDSVDSGGGGGGGLYQFLRPSSYDSREDHMSEMSSLFLSSAKPGSRQ